MELKSAGEDLKENQVMFRRMLLALDHKWYKVQSYKRFLEIIEEHRERR